MLDPERVTSFRFVAPDVDPDAGVVELRYELHGEGLDPELSTFTETVEIPDVGPAAWDDRRVSHAVRLLHLLAGVSYYKTAAPDVIDLGDVPAGAADRALVRATYTAGLAEFTHRNGLDDSDRRVVGGAAHEGDRDAPAPNPLDRPLLPFGGGVDSLVSLDLLEEQAASGAIEPPELFVMQRGETASAVLDRVVDATDRPVRRTVRRLDAKVLRSAELGYRNGHVPVTGVVTGIGLLVAALHGRGAVVLSNERSASAAQTLDGREVNHQWSKSWEAEQLLAAAVADGPAPAAVFSLLRDWPEHAIAARFAELERFHGVFCSCNRAFAIDPDRRTGGWCRECDKCLFVNLALAPFLAPTELEGIFGGPEPLTDPALHDQLRALVDLPAGVRPFECVGDVRECRTALVAAAARDDRDDPALLSLVDELPEAARAQAERDAGEGPRGPHGIPDAYR